MKGNPPAPVIAENTVVGIEFDSRRRAVRFTTPELVDASIGDWIDTRLSDKDFRSIAPVVVLFNPGDAVEIVD